VLDQLILDHLLEVGTLGPQLRQTIHDVLYQVEPSGLFCTRMSKAVVIVPSSTYREATLRYMSASS
jgi:hypothetical protein